MASFELLPSHLQVLERLSALLAEHAVHGWLVGGYVRDTLLRPSGPGHRHRH